MSLTRRSRRFSANIGSIRPKTSRTRSLISKPASDLAEHSDPQHLLPPLLRLGSRSGKGRSAGRHNRPTLNGAGTARQGVGRRRQPPLQARNRTRVRREARRPCRHPRETGGQRDGEACSAVARACRLRLRGTVDRHPAEPDPAHVASSAAGPAGRAAEGRPPPGTLGLQEARQRFADHGSLGTPSARSSSAPTGGSITSCSQCASFSTRARWSTKTPATWSSAISDGTRQPCGRSSRISSGNSTIANRVSMG